MIEFIFYILSQIIPEIKPYDIDRKTDNLYFEEERLAIIFDGNVRGYSEDDNVILVHSKDEAPNINYMNYYVDEIVFEEAVRILKDVGIEVPEIVPIDHAFAEKVYKGGKKYWNDLYTEMIIDYVTREEDNYYPPMLHNGFKLRNWFEMQCDMFCIEYIYNNQRCKIVNSTPKWGLYYSAVRKYMAINNIQNIPQDAEFGELKIGNWISEQRTAYKQGYMTVERSELLKEASISMNTYKDAWSEKFELLKQYKEEYGHTNIEKREKYKGVCLGIWCQHQRDNYKTGNRPITDEQIHLLSELGFDWDPLETEWNRRYQQYKHYIQENDGDPYIPRRRDFEGEHLGAWVETQRKMKTNGKLSMERLQKLTLLNPEFGD